MFESEETIENVLEELSALRDVRDRRALSSASSASRSDVTGGASEKIHLGVCVCACTRV